MDKAAALAYHAAMNSAAEVFLSALISYFVITDPIGVAMIFNGLTADRGKAYRRAMAFKSIALSLGVVLSFAFSATTCCAPWAFLWNPSASRAGCCCSTPPL